MAGRTIVTPSKFARNFGRYQNQAVGGDIIYVSSHGRIVGGFLSEEQLRHFERLKRRERQVLVVGNLPHDIIADIAAAEYGAEPR